MNVVIAIDSFKGSLSSKEAGDAIKSGIIDIFPDASITVCPIADGGEGTVDALVSASGGTFRTITVSDPLMRPVEATYGLIDNTAVIEIAAAAGITLIAPSERNPLYTTTYGVGEIIKDAISLGIREFIIGLGGSATNDGGSGMLRALGFEFYDKNGKSVSYGAIGLSELSSLSSRNMLPELRDCKFYIACDVTNPLCGKNGCSAVFAPQKGADAEMTEKMDSWLSSYADIATEEFENSDKNTPGAGAAGGLGFAFLSFLNANFENGIDLVIRKSKLSEYIKEADIVITGEGRLDSQTAMGKAPIGIAEIAKSSGKKVIAFSGCVTDDAELLNDRGIDAFFPIIRSVVSLDEALCKQNAKKNLSAATRQVFRLIKLYQ